MRNHFVILGVEERFDLELDELERRYRERSREVHPDRFVSASAGERVKAITAATELNEAFRTLKVPVARAEHLLALRGVKIGDNVPVDPGFLTEILELREALQAALRGGDRDLVERMEVDMRARHDASLAAVARQLAGGGDVAAVQRELVNLRYFQRFLDEIEREEAA